MIGMSSDALLFRDAAGILAQRNLSTAQQFRLYNTTDAGLTNYSRAQFEFSGGLFYISTANAGTGPALGLGFWVAGGSKWTIPTTGHFLAGVDNTFDIGASGANRPRTGYFGTSVETPMLIGSNLRINSGGLYFSTNSSVMTAPSNGVIRFTDAGQSTFTRLELGAANLGISRGTGSPEGVVTALVGSLYIRTDGGASTTLYVKESSPTPTTGWVAK
jgi:hypothetical protein